MWLFLSVFAFRSGIAQESSPQLTGEQWQQAITILQTTLQNEERWIKVHVAEFLLSLGYRDEVRKIFEQELGNHRNDPEYRIGIWRVLAKQSQDADQRRRYVNQIRDAFLDDNGPDRIHAVESLAKLNYQADIASVVGDAVLSQNEQAENAVQDALLAASDSQIAGLRVYSRWVLLNSATRHDDQIAAEERISRLLEDPDEMVRRLAAYVFSSGSFIAPNTLAKIKNAVQQEPLDSSARVYLVGALYRHLPAAELQRRKTAEDELLRFAKQGHDYEQYHACVMLSEVSADRSVVADLMENELVSIDVRIAAANAVCRIGRRQVHSLAFLDWIIISIYGIGMLVVGWYYSRRSNTTDDYMLGGRNMRSWAVGMSLFATLISTISYLAGPGEMIKNGPMILSRVLAYPLIVLTICYFMIPFIMRLKVTSAYELLETRFGITVRMLGAVIFLSLRLLWMSVIVFATTDKVLVPIMGLESRIWTPIICSLLCLVTLVYTSWGGLRAVVFTDVIQTAILFFGAVLALVAISFTMGGVSAWWPTEWSDQWAPPSFGFQTDARVTLGWAMVSAFIWYVSTSGSDQMAIQRYLATRDVKSARRAFITTMICDAIVTSLLAILGLALFAYFQAFPFRIPDGQSLKENADQLFPRFIVFGLPVGVSGLVVAGLLAAAMSSLSSGMNSSCAVVTTDFIDRFKKNPMEETDHIRLAKYVSLAVGMIVVALSLFVSVVPGNLLEIAFRVVNLLVVPLFMLFFMAMFVPWATSVGAWSAAICSAFAAATIAYWELLVKWQPIAAILESAGVATSDSGPSFLFIMPTALVVGLIIGPLVSLLPIGPPAKKRISEMTS